METSQKKRQFSLLICLIFVAAAAVLIQRHEMWRDEIQVWLLVRDVGSFGELLGHLKNELHPFLWYALVYPLKFLTKNPEIIKPLHLLIACTTVYLFCRHAPFSRLNKILFIFGYFPFFEYGIIARDYSLVLLFSVLLTILYTSELTSSTVSKTRLYAITGGLFLICQTNLIGIIIGSIFAFLIARDVFLKGDRKKLLPLLGFLGGATIFILQMFPPTNCYATSFGFTHTVSRMELALISVWKGFFPLPVPFLHFWNSNILDIGHFFYYLRHLHYLQHLLAFFVLLGSILFVLTFREPRATLFYCIGTFSIMGVIFVTGALGIRFPGFIFIIFILALWIGYGLKRSVCDSKLISLLLLIHVAATSIAYYYDMRYPFSAAKQAAKFITNSVFRKPIIVGYKYATAISFAGYLDDQIYYPQVDRFGTFMTWDTASLDQLSTCEIMQKARELRAKTKRPVLVVLNYMPEKKELICNPGPSFALLGWTSAAIVANEEYTIWLIR